MVTVLLCEKMGWDYYTYLRQPLWFINLIVGKMQIDAKEAKKEQERGKLR